MTNHSDSPFFKRDDKISDAVSALQEQIATKPFVGATGEFPEGKLNKNDEGAIQFLVGHQNGKVVMDFGTPVHWVGMPPQQAVELAQSLLDHAHKCSDDVLTVAVDE